MKEICIAKLFNEEVTLRADFSRYSIDIERLTDEGEWESIQHQIPAIRRNPKSAMERELEEIVKINGDDPDDYRTEIEYALEDMLTIH